MQATNCATDLPTSRLTVTIEGFELTATPVNPKRLIPPLPALQWQLQPQGPSRVPQGTYHPPSYKEHSELEKLLRTIKQQIDDNNEVLRRQLANSTQASASNANSGTETGMQPSRPDSTILPSSPSFKTVTSVMHMDGDSCQHCERLADLPSDRPQRFDLLWRPSPNTQHIRVHVGVDKVERLKFVDGQLPAAALRRFAAVYRNGVLDYFPSSDRLPRIYTILGVIPEDEIAREVDKMIRAKCTANHHGFNVRLVF